MAQKFLFLDKFEEDANDWRVVMGTDEKVLHLRNRADCFSKRDKLATETFDNFIELKK